MFEDEGAEYEYKGEGKFARTKTPTLAQQKQQKDEDKRKRKQGLLDAAKAEKEAQKKLHIAEAVRNDLDKMAEVIEERKTTPKIRKRHPKKAETQVEKSVIESSPVVLVGSTSTPTPNGFYWEFRKDEKPYGIKNVYHDDLGVLCECKNKSEAEVKIAAYESEASRALQQGDCPDLRQAS